MPSIWTETVEIESRPPLQQSLQTSVAVIGAGMAGLLTAYLLKMRDVDCVVLEADAIGSGQTKGTTAKITSQHGKIYGELIEQFGVEKAKQYAAANQHAVEQYRELICSRGIDCDFEETKAYLYGFGSEDGLEKEALNAAALGLPASYLPRSILPFATTGAVCFAQQAQFHPLKFLKHISRELTIYEHTPVTKVEGHFVTAGGYRVTADKIIFAAHFPFVNVPGFYFARMYQSRAYSIALENASLPDGMFIGCGEESLSLRKYHNLIILCDSDHRTGENRIGGRYEHLRKMAGMYFPENRETAHWSAQDCMTPDKVPYIGQYAVGTPDWYVATGFNKWGMSSSMAAAQILADAVTGGRHPNAEIFDPQRFNTSTAGELLKNGGKAVEGLSRRILTLPKTTLEELPMGHGGIVEHEGEKIGVYKDASGNVYTVNPRCPHMGCQLEWNPDEKSWDCPCHGSRFDYRGHLLDNPAQENLPYEQQI